jgi:hypothetical protein
MQRASLFVPVREQTVNTYNIRCPVCEDVHTSRLS